MSVAAYLRTSTDLQAESHGTDAQRHAIERWAKYEREGPIEWYVDEGASGATMDRPAWDRLMADIGAGRFRTVVTYSLSRAGRTVLGLTSWLEEMRERKVRLVFVAERLDTETAMGRCMFTIAAAFAQLERELIGERTSAGIQALMARGERWGGARVVDPSRNGCAKITEAQVGVVAERLRTNPGGLAAEAAAHGLSADRLYRRIRRYEKARPLRGGVG